jgi:hypothetical protein
MLRDWQVVNLIGDPAIFFVFRQIYTVASKIWNQATNALARG